MNIPQLLGYARIAGAPLAAGLYTALLSPVAFAMFGSSRRLVVAADSGTAAILAGSLSSLAAPGSAHYLALAGATAFITAGMLLTARVFRLGFLADFLSRTVLVGFLTGVGVQVSVAMLGDMLGVTVTSRRTPLQLLQVAGGLPHSSLPALGLACLVVVVILAGRRFAPRFPAGLVLVAGSIAASRAWDFAAHGLAVIGPVPAGLPALGLPRITWRELLRLLPIAGACFVVILAQSAATARAFAAKHQERDDQNGDLLGLSVANGVAALSGAFVVNGSPTQTAMAERAGAGSQLAQIVFSACVLVVLLALTGPLQYLPRCVLAAIVFTIAINMIDVATLRAMSRESPGELRLALATAAAVAAIGVEQGVLLAIALSLLRHVRHSYRPYTAVLRNDPQRGWTEVPPKLGAQTEPGLVIYRFGADLFFANAPLFADEVRALIANAPTPVRWLVIEADAMTNIDYTAARILLELIRELTRDGVELAFARAGEGLRADMERHGVTAALGSAHIFATRHAALAAARPG